MATKQYLNAFINSSPTVREKAGADITNAAHKAVMYDAGGDAVLATDAAQAFGLVLSDAPAHEEAGGDLTTKAGTEIDVLIKDIGLMEAGGPLAKGDPVTVNASGQAVKAASGQFVFGWARTGASAGEAAQVQVTRSGPLA